VSDFSIGTWTRLVGAATAGELVVERGIARRCAQCGEDLVSELKQMQAGALGLAKVDGFCHLSSGVAMTAKFERKASGGKYSLDRAVADHVSVVEQMRDVFLQIEARYAAAEEANAAATRVVASRIS
jgi:hypothetical protein